ncbi:MAG: gliding motility-associated C-terminal domain-containing protein [Bacteroidales bacterium]|nr:gliding motility-associated C-terminal domain-containing protein [Bacteroidales bacterium]
MGIILSVNAQSRPVYPQNSHCAGLKNPSYFTVAGGSANAQWTGYTGSKPATLSTCTTPGANFTTTVQAAQLESTTGYSSSCESNPTYNIDGVNDVLKRFVIKGSGNDPVTGNNISYLPPDTSFHTSIRLGNTCPGAEAEMLQYEFNVTSENCLVTIWFAMSLENALHGQASNNPEFSISVEKQNPTTNAWSLAGGDTLCYIQASPTSSSNLGNFTQYGNNVYLQWRKVIVNLSKLQYQRVRIKIASCDCSQSGHYGYCYFAGECQPMKLNPIGCAAGETDSVARIDAPSGAQNYKWYRSKTGELPDAEKLNMSNYIEIIGATQPSLGATLDQFVHATTGEIMSKNTFLCEMTTMMNQTLPVVSRIAATTGNTKPTLVVDSALGCNANITLTDKSVTPYSPRPEDMVDTNHTVWKFYSSANPSPSTLVATEVGGTVSHTYNNAGNYCVTVRTSAYDTTCWNEKTIKIRTVKNPIPRVNISANNLCKGDTISISDMTANSHSQYHRWTIGDTTFMKEGIGFRWSFNETTDVTLVTRGTEHFKADTTGDGIVEDVYCYSDTTFRIFVGNYPGPKAVGDTIVCNGYHSDIHIQDSVADCRYDWYQVYNGTVPYLENNEHLETTINQDRTFYVKATSPFGCVSWDSVNLYLVKPDLQASRNKICTDDTVILTAGKAAYFEWSSNPIDPELATQSTESEIVVSPKQTTVYTVIGHGTNGCSATPLTQRIEVYPYPIFNIRLTPDFIDSENPSVQFSDQSEYGTTSLWNFGNGQTSTYRTVVHTFTDLSEDSLLISLVTGNAIGCTVDTSFYVPVGIFAVWFPNAFTPRLETNNKFKAYTANELEDYELYIYDRSGSLVFSTNDIEEGWDGTYKGQSCKNGTYVWIAKYRRKGAELVLSQKGTVTLLR